MTGVTLDTGALLALEAGGRRMTALVETALRNGLPLAIPAGVLAQAWRASARQVRLARLVRASITEVVPLDQRAAFAVGRLCRDTGAADVIDVSVMFCARERRHDVVTSDPDDLRVIDPTIRLMAPA